MKIEFNLKEDIQNLINCKSTEVYQDLEKGKVYIPYLLSDMLECYIEFSDCTVTGKWDKKRDSIVDFSLTENEGKNGLVLRQKDGAVITIWYSQAQKYLEKYQYHLTGHCWIKGQENWRRIVYIIGTMCDKYSFMGEAVCNQTELELIPFVEFGPFSYWTPINESFEDYYPFSQEGIECAERIAHEIGDTRLLKIARRYGRDLVKDKLTDRRLEKYARQLIKCKKLYHYLNDQIIKASLQYEPRNYCEKDRAYIEKMRKNVIEEYQSKGYNGDYPCLRKGRKQIHFYEEHPYILRDFEYENFTFNIWCEFEFTK